MISPWNVMIEKWMLVLLIVGCTSLVFIICLPVDFYLYRRRKRHARERKNITINNSQQAQHRAAQYHAKVSNVFAEIDCNEVSEIEQRKHRAERGVMKFLSMLRKKPMEDIVECQERANKKTLSESQGFDARTKFEKNNKKSNCHPETYEDVYNISHSDKAKKGSSKSINCKSYDDDYLDYSPKIPLSRVSKSWDENQFSKFTYKNKQPHFRLYCKKRTFDSEANTYVTRRDKKRTLFGDVDPLEKKTDMFGKTRDEYHSPTPIPIRIRNENHLQPVDTLHEHCKDDENKLIYKEVPRGDNNDKLINQFTKGGLGTEGTSKDKQLGSDQRFQAEVKKDKQTLRNVKGLTHSQSEQCLTANIKHSTRSRRKGRNIVSPVNNNIFPYSEEVIGGENNLNGGSPVRVYEPAFSEDRKTLKGKAKRISRNGRQSSESMPDIYYKREKY